MIGIKFETKLLADRRQAQNNFHHRERSADARTRSAAERKIRVPGQTLDEILSPSLRPKRLRLVVKSRVALRGPLKHEHLRAGPDLIPANFAIFNRFASQTVSR